MSDYGIVPDTRQDIGPALQNALKKIKADVRQKDKVVLNFSKGTYNFHMPAAQTCTYYISNHDQNQPKPVMFNLTEWHNLTLNGNGSDFIFHGRMIPFVIAHCANTTLRDFSIDFSQPQIGQVEILKNSAEEGITFKIAPWMTYRLDGKAGTLTNLGEGWENTLTGGMAFEKGTRHVVYNTGDLGYDLHDATEVSPRVVHAPRWKDARLIPGTVVAMRSWYRPTPGIFATESRDVGTDAVWYYVVQEYQANSGACAWPWHNGTSCNTLWVDGHVSAAIGIGSSDVASAQSLYSASGMLSSPVNNPQFTPWKIH